MSERSEWNYSPMRNRLFEICSYLTVVTATLSLCSAILSLFIPEQTHSIAHPQWFIRVGFGVLFFVLAVCVLSQWLLWIGMMVWTAFWSGEWIVLRILLVLAQLITLSFGSALVYAIFYRTHHNRIQSRALLRAGVTG